MKLALIAEMNQSRRDFLKTSGRGLLGILTSVGIPVDVAKSITTTVAGNPSQVFGVMQHVQDSTGAFYTDANESVNVAWSGLGAFKRNFGLDPSLVFGPDSLMVGGKVGANSLPQFFAGMARNGWQIEPEGDGYFYLTKGNEELTVSPTGLEDEYGQGFSFADFSGYTDFLKKWWAGWMRSSLEPSTPKFREFLGKHGIDYYANRDGAAVEMALEQMRTMSPDEFTAQYGDMGKWLQMADAAGVEPDSELRAKASGEEAYRPRPDDYIYGSSMHQPFESRLRLALGSL